MHADETRLAMPRTVPCLGRTLRLFTGQMARCPSVRRAWISTLQYGDAQPQPCVLIGLNPGVSDEAEVLRSIVDPLMVIAAGNVSEGDIGTTDEMVRNELMTFAWLVADDRMQAELSDGAGVPIYH
jgi:hypothetical protein